MILAHETNLFPNMDNRVAKCMLLIDCGTSDVKSTLLLLEQPRFRFLEPVRHGNCAVSATSTENRELDANYGQNREWDPELLTRIVSRVFYHEAKRATECEASISAVSVTSTASSLTTLVDNVLAPDLPSLAWDDRQASQEAEWLEAKRASTASLPWMRPIDADSGIAKAMFLAKLFHRRLRQPGTHVVEQWTFLNWLLTNSFFQSDSILARKWGLARDKRYPDKFSRLLAKQINQFTGHAETECVKWFTELMLPGNVVTAGSQLGSLSPTFRQPLNLSREIKVIAAPFDTASQALGLGLLSTTGRIGVTFGTSLGVIGLVPIGKVRDVAARIPDCPASGAGFVFDGISSCGNAINQVCRLHGLLNDGAPDYQAISKAISSTQPGASGVIMLPFFNGGRRRAALRISHAQIHGIAMNTSREEVVRALCEAICFTVHRILQDIRRQIDFPFNTLTVSGGPTACKPLLQMLADVTGCTVENATNRDTGLLGCAACALVGTQLASNLQAAHLKLGLDFEKFEPDRNEKVSSAYQRAFSEFISRFGDCLKTDT